MIVVRNVFRCKPGQAKVLVSKFKEGFAALGTEARHRVLTDVAAGFWTVVLETESADLADWEKLLQMYGENPEVRKAMDGYMDLVEGGHREIFRVE